MRTVASPGALPPAATSFSTPRATSPRTRRATAVPSISRAVIEECSLALERRFWTGGATSGEGLERLRPPGLRRVKVVEREDVEAGEGVVRLADVRGQPLDDLGRVVAARQEEAPDEVLLLLQEAGGGADPQTAGDPEELLTMNRTGHADVDGQVDPAALELAGPVQDDRRVEDDLRLDVGRQVGLVLQRLEQHVLGHGRVPLGMAADADVGETVVELVQRDQEVVRVLELGRGVRRIPTDDEHVGDRGLPETGDEVGQMCAVADLLCRQVW